MCSACARAAPLGGFELYRIDRSTQPRTERASFNIRELERTLSACAARPKFVTSHPQGPCPSASNSHAYKVALNTTPKSAKTEPTAKSSAVRTRREGCSAPRIMIATLITKSPDQMAATISLHAIAARNPAARCCRRRPNNWGR